ncbi:hypothetical protein P886_1459 [Alteromonadaceae bacterium 2753L.S.0a.02]|nr:hypothetical protein P886_1459 [Alteromonadaceae bacterium 2753L.S.0a.02]
MKNLKFIISNSYSIFILSYYYFALSQAEDRSRAKFRTSLMTASVVLINFVSLSFLVDQLTVDIVGWILMNKHEQYFCLGILLLGGVVAFLNYHCYVMKATQISDELSRYTKYSDAKHLVRFATPISILTFLFFIFTLLFVAGMN